MVVGQGLWLAGQQAGDLGGGWAPEERPGCPQGSATPAKLSGWRGDGVPDLQAVGSGEGTAWLVSIR